MPRIPLLGGAYNAPSLIAGAQRSLNLFPEKNPDWSQAPVNVTHYPRCGLKRLSSPPNPGLSRALYGATNGDLYAVIDVSIYYIDPDFKFNLIGNLLTVTNDPVSLADNGTSGIIVDGDLSATTIDLATRTTASLGDPNYMGSNRADFLDYFLIFNQPGTPNWYCTEANSLVFNPLFFGTKTAWPDNILAVVAIEREAWVFGPKKTEVWYNSGGVPFPFQALPGLIVEHGCSAKFSIAKQDIHVYWLSQSPEGARMAMKNEGHAAKRISTTAIENEWLTYGRVDDAIGSCYQIKGHAFYQLHFPTADKTWTYDEATDLWFEEASLDINGNLHRAKNTFNAYSYGKNLALDWNTGDLLQVDPSTYSDNGNPIAFLRSMPHVIDDEFDRVTIWRLIADMETGTTPDTYPVVTAGVEPPLVSLRVSNNGGGSYGNAIMQPMGYSGKYRAKPTWNRLGFGADWVFELSWSSAVKTGLNGVFITTEKHEADSA